MRGFLVMSLLLLAMLAYAYAGVSGRM